MKPAEIRDFIAEQFTEDTILYCNGEDITYAETFENAGPGAISWLLSSRLDRLHDFKGSMLLSSRLAMMKVIERFFPPGPDRDDVRGPGIGGSGFTFEWDGDHYMRWPHIGGVDIAEDVEIGRFTAIDRGSIGNTTIRKGVKIDNLVHIAHNCDIGEHSIIVAGSVICGSVKIGRNVYVGANATIRHRLSIGDNAIIGMGAVVTKDVPAGECWMGNPARFYRRSDEVSRP